MYASSSVDIFALIERHLKEFWYRDRLNIITIINLMSLLMHQTMVYLKGRSD